MNDNYIFDYINLLERVLSYGYKNNYSLKAVERMISYSSFFQSIEKENRSSIITDNALITQLFDVKEVDMESIPVFNQCLWSAESYMRIQKETSLTFEAIFIYLPLKKMYDFFPLYHEMDFLHIIEVFKNLYSKQSILSLLLNEYGFTLKDVSEKTDIPYDTLYSIKQRRRDVNKTSYETIYKLANVFKVRMETISETKQ